MYDRILKLISAEQLQKIKNTRILLVGLGGVGGFAFELLVRSGFQNITVIDEDIIEESNINRQILATSSSVGVSKVECAKKRAKDISCDVKIQMIQKHLKEEDVNASLLDGYDYILDACDTVSVKIAFIKECTRLKKKLISSMGTANRFHPEMLEILPLKDTKGDPLAKKVRNCLRKEKDCFKTMVVCSKEIPRKQKELGTLAPVPMTSGALLVSYVLNDLFSL